MTETKPSEMTKAQIVEAVQRFFDETLFAGQARRTVVYVHFDGDSDKEARSALRSARLKKVKALYEQGMGLCRIAKACQTTQTQIEYDLQFLGLKLARPSMQKQKKAA